MKLIIANRAMGKQFIPSFDNMIPEQPLKIKPVLQDLRYG